MTSMCTYMCTFVGQMIFIKLYHEVCLKTRILLFVHELSSLISNSNDCIFMQLHLLFIHTCSTPLMCKTMKEDI